jgi:2,4-dichlorophenol 6-monooxygenase
MADITTDVLITGTGPAGSATAALFAGKGRFAIFTGIGGEGWIEAGRAVGKALGLDIAGYVIGPRQDWEDYAGDWERAREVRDNGVVSDRPDQYVGSRCETFAADPAGELRRAFKTILDR